MRMRVVALVFASILSAQQLSSGQNDTIRPSSNTPVIAHMPGVTEAETTAAASAYQKLRPAADLPPVAQIVVRLHSRFISTPSPTSKTTRSPAHGSRPASRMKVAYTWIEPWFQSGHLPPSASLLCRRSRPFGRRVGLGSRLQSRGTRFGFYPAQVDSRGVLSYLRWFPVTCRAINVAVKYNGIQII
jgi:hypothetical protein